MQKKDERELLNSQTTYQDDDGWSKPLTVVDHSPKTYIGFSMTQGERELNREALRLFKEKKFTYINSLQQELMEKVSFHYPHLMEYNNNEHRWYWLESLELLLDDLSLDSLYTHIKNTEKHATD